MPFPTKALIFMFKVHYGRNIKCSEMKHAGIKVEYWSLNYMIAYNFPCLIEMQKMCGKLKTNCN